MGAHYASGWGFGQAIQRGDEPSQSEVAMWKYYNSERVSNRAKSNATDPALL